MKEQFNEWKERGSEFKGSFNTFYLDINPDAKNTLLILHGYPTCSFDYIHVIDQLSSHYRLVIPDFIGFGLSAKPPNYSYMLADQANNTVSLIKHLNIKNVSILAHDYGTSVCTEILALDLEGKLPFAIKHTTLCNGSMLIHMSRLRPIQKLLKNKITGPLIAFLSNRNTFHRNMKNIWHNAQLYDQDEMDVLWEMLIYRKGKKRLPVLTQYIDQRYKNYDRWIGALKETTVPIHILWAENDPVAVIDMAYELNKIIKSPHLTTIPECGHYPMIEQPELWSSLVLKGLETRSPGSTV